MSGYRRQRRELLFKEKEVEKKKVVVLGATGMVGQKVVSLLDGHPWFEVVGLCASGRSVGKTFAQAVEGRWHGKGDIPAYARTIMVTPCEAVPGVQIAFGALDSSVAGPIEKDFANNGAIVCSNSKNHRMDNDVPLMIPEINADHLELLKKQNYQGGGIVTNPNCSTLGLALAIAPLHKDFGLRRVVATTLQAVSGAGYPGVSSLDVIDNCIPFIGGEEEKMEIEPLKILGEIDRFADFKVSSQCNRVPFSDGHFVSASVELVRKASKEEVIESFRNFDPLRELALPSTPEKPLVYLEQDNRPQPRLDRDRGNGMTVSIGRLKEDTIFDFRFVALVHNLVRGAAGAAIQNAELLVKKGYIA